MLSMESQLDMGLATTAELERAQRESLRRVRSAAASSGRFATLRRDLVVLAAALVAILAVVAWPRTPVASPSIPEGEVLVERSSDLGFAWVTLSVEQGSFAARRGQNFGVIARADLRFQSPSRGGTAEIRIREPGDAYGILSTNSDISGATKVRLEGRFPPRGSGGLRTYEVWVHIETPEGSGDTAPILLDVESVPSGERARVR